MKFNKLSIILLVVNFFLLWHFHAVNKKYQMSDQKMQHRLDKAINFSQLLLSSQDQLDDLTIPDSLKDNFVLYIPKQSCSTCVDSAMLILNSFQKNNENFNFCIVSNQINDYMRKFMRYNRIRKPIVKVNKPKNMEEEITFPLLAFYNMQGEFKHVIPIEKNYLYSFKYCLKTMFKE